MSVHNTIEVIRHPPDVNSPVFWVDLSYDTQRGDSDSRRTLTHHALDRYAVARLDLVAPPRHVRLIFILPTKLPVTTPYELWSLIIAPTPHSAN